MMHRTGARAPLVGGASHPGSSIPHQHSDPDDDREALKKQITRWEQCRFGVMIAMYLCLMAMCIAVIFLVLRVNTIVDRVNEYTDEDSEKGKTIKAITQIVANANMTVSDLKGKAPAWMVGIDGAFNALTPEKMKTLVYNVIAVLELVARQNITAVIDRGTEVLTAVNAMFHRDALVINIPMPFAPQHP